MPHYSPAYRDGQQLIMEGKHLRAIEHFLALAQADPQQAADAYERIAGCYFNLDDASAHRSLIHLLRSSRRAADDASRWRLLADGARRAYNRAAAWFWIAIEAVPEYCWWPAGNDAAARLMTDAARSAYRWASAQPIKPRHRRAAAWLWMAIQAAPEHSTALNRLAGYLSPRTPLKRELMQRAEEAALRTGRLPPLDPRDSAGWDRFWGYRLDDEPEFALTFLIELVEPLLPTLRHRGLQRVLCVGNGISLEPRAFAHAGLTATALDISPRATAFARSFESFHDYLPHFFSSEQARDGGSVAYVVGDLLDAACLAGPYDVVIARRVLQCFPEAQRPQAMDAIIARLAPHGILVVHQHNIGPQLFDQLSSRGFHISTGRLKSGFQYDEHAPGFLDAPGDTRAAWLVVTSG